MAEITVQRINVARLVSYAERIIQSGKLPAFEAERLREYVNETCAAFGMAPVQEAEML